MKRPTARRHGSGKGRPVGHMATTRRSAPSHSSLTLAPTKSPSLSFLALVAAHVLPHPLFCFPPLLERQNHLCSGSVVVPHIGAAGLRASPAAGLEPGLQAYVRHVLAIKSVIIHTRQHKCTQVHTCCGPSTLTTGVGTRVGVKRKDYVVTTITTVCTLFIVLFQLGLAESNDIPTTYQTLK